MCVVVVVYSLDGPEEGFRLLAAFEEILEGILASATTLLGTGTLVTSLVLSGSERELLLLLLLGWC